MSLCATPCILLIALENDMGYRAYVLWIIVLASLLVGCADTTSDERITLVRGGTVLTMSESGAHESHTIVIRNGVIDRVVPDADPDLPSGSHIIEVDASGLFVIPGMSDMHVHTFAWGTDLWPVSPEELFLAHGVTTVRDCGAFVFGEPADLTVSDTPLGYLNVIRSTLDSDVDPDNAALHDDTTFLKFKNVADPVLARGLLEQAEAQAIYTVGHVDAFESAEAAVSAGLDEIAHIRQLSKSARSPEWAAVLLEHGTVVHSTLGVYAGIISRVSNPHRFLDSDDIRYLPAHYVESFEEGSSRDYRIFTDEWGGVSYQTDMLERDYSLLVELHQAGIPVLAASDAGAAVFGLVPGKSLLDEVVILARNGFSPYEALETVTTVAGMVCARMQMPQPIGAIVPEARGDLVLLRDDPRISIEALYSTQGVVVGGVHLNQEWITSVRGEGGT